MRKYFVLVAFLVGIGTLAALFRSGPSIPRVSEQQVRDALTAAVQREADTTFVVTGYIDVVAATRSEDSRVILPELLNLSLGTTTATVRVPGRVSYGFDVSDFTPEMIRVRGDTVEIQLPLVQVYSAEPDLSRLEVETRTGWARTEATAREAQQRAVRLLTEALARQGEAHIRDSAQPEVNTGYALRRIAEPVVVSLGITDPRFRIHLGEGLLLEP